MEPVSKIEIPKTPAPEAKPQASPPPKDQAGEKSPSVTTSGTARATLEAIAAGKPVAEVTRPPENLPSREAVDALLHEANTVLLELRDMRLLVTSLATQAIDTPLGNEVRLDALRSIAHMNTEGLSPEAASQVTALTDKIQTLNLPDPKPQESATLSLVTRYNEQHADKPIPEEVIDQIRTGKRGASETLAQLLQTNPDLAQMTWKELTGQDGFAGLSPTPEIMLDLAGIEKNPENMQKAQEIFGTAAGMKEPPVGFMDQAMPILMYGALGIMFISQITTGEQGGGGGH